MYDRAKVWWLSIFTVYERGNGNTRLTCASIREKAI